MQKKTFLHEKNFINLHNNSAVDRATLYIGRTMQLLLRAEVTRRGTKWQSIMTDVMLCPISIPRNTRNARYFLDVTDADDAKKTNKRNGRRSRKKKRCQMPILALRALSTLRPQRPLRWMETRLYLQHGGQLAARRWDRISPTYREWLLYAIQLLISAPCPRFLKIYCI